MRREFHALAALLTRVARTTGRGRGDAERSLRLRGDAPFTRQGFPVARKSWGGEVGETPRPARMCQHPPDPPPVGQGILTRRSAHWGRGGETGSNRSGVCF